MIAVVQPIWEGLTVFAWCLLFSVVPNETVEGPTHEQQVNEAACDLFDHIGLAVNGRAPERYLAKLSPELQKKHCSQVQDVLTKHCLYMRYALEPVAISSYEATYKAKILTGKVCPSNYQDNIEYAVITISATPANTDGKFFSAPSGDEPEMTWTITKWETEKVVPYDRNKD